MALLRNSCSLIGSQSQSIVPSTVKNSNEIEDYYSFTTRLDSACKFLLSWLKSVGEPRFPWLSKLANDIFTVLGSSVPSECAFAHSGQYMTAGRAKMSDENLCKEMKLSSWIEK